MSQELPIDIQHQINAIVDAYRGDCLWYIRKDYYPRTLKESVSILEDITKSGDVAAFRKAGGLRQWLLQHFSATSAK